eukprot:GEMP01009601.1.p1 GENE.GEMP01009601.1~~GEMP01009601.1.p1  ORF type:complete len:809 (+),score=156.79 GEMP01009601.1:211-2637(+)
MYGAWFLWLLTHADPSEWCPTVHKNRQRVCEPCVLPYSQDDLCDIGLTCHFYMRRCVTIGHPVERSEDIDLMQNSCPVDPNDRTTWWARCITNSCVVSGRVAICPELCVNPDFPCYWVDDCHVSSTMLNDCDRQCEDKAWLLHKANTRFWQDSRIFENTTCQTASNLFGCKTGIGAEVRWICPQKCNTGACVLRCREMVPKEELRGDVRCASVVPEEKSCEEATALGIDCHCTCASYYGTRGGSLGRTKVPLPVEITTYVGVEFDLHLTGIRLHLEYLSSAPKAMVKIVEGTLCRVPQSEYVQGLPCVTNNMCQAHPTFSAPYYQRWNAIILMACGTYTVCYCGGDNCVQSFNWLDSGTIRATRVRPDTWTYFPMDQCWDGPLQMDYPGPLADVAEKEVSDAISIVFTACGTSSWETLTSVLMEYLKHRSLATARPKVGDVTTMPRNVSTGYPTEDECEVMDFHVATHSEESRKVMYDRMQIIADNSARFVDTFYITLHPPPTRIRLQIKALGAPRDTFATLGLAGDSTEGVATTTMTAEEGESFWGTSVGIAIIIVICVVFGGTLAFILWNVFCTKTIHGTTEVSEQGYRTKVTPDTKISTVPTIEFLDIAHVARVAGRVRALVNAKWKRMWAPKEWQRSDAPLKWQGATEELEEVPVNCAPYPGALVRVSGLTAAEYNGMRGVVKEGPNDKNRFLVQIVIQEDEDDARRETKELSLRPDNLMVVEEVATCTVQPSSPVSSAEASSTAASPTAKRFQKAKAKTKAKSAPPVPKSYRATAKQSARACAKSPARPAAAKSPAKPPPKRP